jgi:hypothetical protein
VVGVIGGDTVRAGLARLPESVSQRLPELGLGLGLASGLGSLAVYDRSGYGHGMLWLWLASLAMLGMSFGARSTAIPRIARLDLAMPAALALFFSPLYLLELYRWPVQVSSDEIGVMSASERLSSMPDVDPFGISYYRAFPAALFVGWGKLGNLFGGVELGHMRFLHALFGLVVIAASYALFRQLLPRSWAVCASLLLGFSHSFLMISRLAMRENTAVLTEVIALALLLWGLRRNHELASFAGGLVAGMGFYIYYPGRATFPLWILFLIGLGVFYRRSFSLRRLVTLGLVASVGFVLMAAPILIAERNAPRAETAPAREALLIYKEGRAQQRAWFFAKDEWSGYKINLKYGLGTFNNRVVDHAWIYENHGHGFVDPLTGILLWLGVGVAGMGLIRRRAEPESLLLFGSFIVLWLSFAFVINKAPNYTRLLVTLPFVAYLVTEALRWLADRWRSVPRASAALVVALVGAIAIWNLAIGWDFVQKGRQTGDKIGTTGRYVSSHAGMPGIHFYMSTDDSGNNSYYDFGNDAPIPDRLRLFAADDTQIGYTVNPYQLSSFNGTPPFALFMRRTLWATAATNLADRYPHGRLRNVLPSGTLVVFEVPRR